MVFWPMLPDKSIPFEAIARAAVAAQDQRGGIRQIQRDRRAAVAGERVVGDAELMDAGWLRFRRCRSRRYWRWWSW